MTHPERCHLSALGLVTALGRGKEAVASGLFSGVTTGLALEEGWLPEGPARVGRVPGVLEPLPARFASDDSRNTRLLLTALEEIRAEVDREISRHGRHRIGVVLGTSTATSAPSGPWPTGCPKARSRPSSTTASRRSAAWTPSWPRSSASRVPP